MPSVYRDLSCGMGYRSTQVHSEIKKHVCDCRRCRTMFSLAEHALQHHVAASILILRITHVYAILHWDPVEVIFQMLERITLRAHVIEQRLH